MDLPDSGFSDEESFFDGLMTVVSPVPDHLKHGRAREEVILDGDNDAANDDEVNVGVEEDNILEKDPSDEEILQHNARLDEVEQIEAEVTPPVDGVDQSRRRRLKRKAQRPIDGPGEEENDDVDAVRGSFEREIEMFFEDVGGEFTHFDEGADGGEKIARDLGVGDGSTDGRKEKDIVVEPQGEVCIEKRVKKRKLLKKKFGGGSKKGDMVKDGDVGFVGETLLGPVRQSKTPGPSASTVPAIGVLAKKKKKMMQKKKKTTVEYDISSGDDEIKDPRSGQKRKGCGYLFANAPKALMTQFLTRDDKLKLGKCALPRKIKKFERSVARVSTAGLK